MFNALAVGGIIASLLTTAVAAPMSAPMSDDTAVNVITINGSGCPTATAVVRSSPDGRSLEVTFGGYFAWRGPGARPIDFRKNCIFSLLVPTPEGLTYAISGADYSGFANLQAGAIGLERASYWVQGSSQTTSIGHSFNGPMSDDWSTTDVIEVASLSYVPCDASRYFNINTELRVNAGTSDPAALNLMAFGQAITFRLTWKSCR
jgi:hypothetical protein